ncbi:MAG: ABC transporter ATP-binding protein [Bdellovibrionales bacterium]|nr:ABC transporter ATP-binding protein [Bdellovibrionales bacterium]
MSTPSILEVRSLTKSFKSPAGKVDAVRGISFSIQKGTCFGLLGPNGAGKTTTIEMMEGIQKPSGGKILFHGEDLGADFKQRSGIQFQSTALPDYLRVGEVLNLFASFYKSSVNLEDLAKRCRLLELWKRDAHNLSGGQRQRLLLAIALVNDPEIVFLDEPTTGLDPGARREFWELVESVKAQGKTLLLTTHYMEEAYALCDEIAIMDQGKIIAQGEPNQLLKTHFDGVTIEVPSDDFKKATGKLPFPVFERPGSVEIPTRDVEAVIQFLMGAKISLDRIMIRPRTLEDLFLQLTRKGGSPA